MAPKIKPITTIPVDGSLSPQVYDTLQAIAVSLNQLIGQANAPSGQGLSSLSLNTVDPTSSTINSAGSRTSSVTTNLAFVAGTTSITFYWDGTNGSLPFQVYRDDGSITTPYKTGSPQVVSGLTASTKYYFYIYWDDSAGALRFVTIPGVAVGSPAYAFTAPNIKAQQLQILRQHVPVSGAFGTAGISTTSSGTSGGGGGTGGGGGGGGGGGYL